MTTHGVRALVTEFLSQRVERVLQLGVPLVYTLTFGLRFLATHIRAYTRYVMHDVNVLDEIICQLLRSVAAHIHVTTDTGA